MKKHMVLSTNKHPTKLGKALHGISWMMLMMWIMVGAILLVSEFSFRSILLWLICCAAGVLQLIGIQVLISRYERKQKTPSERASVQQQTGKRETASTFAENDGFEVAGVKYTSFDDLRHAEIPWEDKETRLFSDSYGRLVLYDTELYPCFDSYDAIFEKRKYHLFYILTNNSQAGQGQWACVRFPDEKTGAQVLFQNLPFEEIKVRVAERRVSLFEQMEQMQAERGKHSLSEG